MRKNLALLAIAALLVAAVAYADDDLPVPPAPEKVTVMGHACGMMGQGNVVMEKEIIMRGGGGCCGMANCIHPGMLLKMADEIGLDANQKAQIDKMTQENGLVRIDKEAELEKAQLTMKHLMKSEASEKEVLAQMDKIGALETGLQKMCYQHCQAVKAILNKEQLEKAKKLMMKCCSSDDPMGMGAGPGPKAGLGCSKGDMMMFGGCKKK